mgnify:CR=1 FL=1
MILLKTCEFSNKEQRLMDKYVNFEGANLVLE